MGVRALRCLKLDFLFCFESKSKMGFCLAFWDEVEPGKAVGELGGST